jgi:Holliday junction resolvase RusA-like endonuclease
MIELFIKGIAIPQGRPRARVFTMGNHPKVSMYDPKPSKDWKAEIAKQAQSWLSERAKEAREFLEAAGKSVPGPMGNHELFKGPLKMELVFYMLKPKSYPKSVVHHTKKPDIDNLAKAVSDGLNGIFYKDDSQIVDLRIRKMYCEDSPGVRVKISVVDAPF